MEIRHPQLYKITKNQRSKLSKSNEISKALLKKRHVSYEKRTNAAYTLN